MPQKYFPILPSVDWLQLTCRTRGCIMACPQDSPKFSWHERDYGTKQYSKVFEVSLTSDTEAPIPFCTICSNPRMATISPETLSLQLSNRILYDNSQGDWRVLLDEFCSQYGIAILRITRCDLALDFLYLNNRVSGPQLIRNLKNFTWLKTGSVKVSEHYTMPYSVKGVSDTLNGEFDIQYYLQARKLQARVETMMFGTLKSEAAVCIYDKTAELAQHSVKLKVDGEDKIVCAKEYIRDAHKQACVYDPKMHTWRIEIRVKNTASFIRDMGSKVERPLSIFDLNHDRLSSTIYAALNHYFYLVQAPADMFENGLFNAADTRLKNKKRLKKVDLVPAIPDNIAMVRSHKTLKASQYTRGVLNRIEEWATRKDRAEELLKTGAELSVVDKAINEVNNLAQRKASPELQKLATLMADVKETFATAIDKMPDACKSTIIDAISVIEHFRILETRGYCKTIAKKFEDLATAIDIKDISKSSAAHGLRFVPSDAAILRDARKIVQSFYAPGDANPARLCRVNIYRNAILNCIRAINERPDFPPLQAFKALYGYAINKEYLSDDEWLRLLKTYRYTPVYLIIISKFDMDVYFRTMHYPWIDGYYKDGLLPHQEEQLNKIVRLAASIKSVEFDNPIIV